MHCLRKLFKIARLQKCFQYFYLVNPDIFSLTFICHTGSAFPIAQEVKNLPAMHDMQEMQVWSLGGEDPLEKGVGTHSSIPA